MRIARFSSFIIAIDIDFVLPVDNAAVNPDDGEVLCNYDMKKEGVRARLVNGDSRPISFNLINLSLIVHQLFLQNCPIKRLSDVRWGLATDGYKLSNGGAQRRRNSLAFRVFY